MKKSAPATRVARTQKASQERREQERRDLRDLILAAAGQEFLEKGYDSFSLRRVAERIGYTPTTIYLHFRNKDELLLATVQEGFEAFDKRMEQTAAAYSDPIERIEALGRAYIDFGLQNPALYRLMFMQRSDFYFMPRFVEEDANHDGGATSFTTESEQSGETGQAAKQAKPLASLPTTKSKPAVKHKEISNAKNLSPDIGGGERPRTVAMALLVAAVEEGIATGQVKATEPLIAADVLWAGAHGLVSLAISPLMSPEHAQKVIDSLLATLISGVQLH